MELKDLLEIIKGFTDIEIIEENKTHAKIYLREYGFTYPFNIDDIEFIEALQIIFHIEINFASKYTFTTEDIKLFSADDLLELRQSIKEDCHYLKCLYQHYFYEAPDFKYLKNNLNKNDVLKYIKVINKIAKLKRNYKNFINKLKVKFKNLKKEKRK
jgi:hypothetical protein